MDHIVFGEKAGMWSGVASIVVGLVKVVETAPLVGPGESQSHTPEVCRI